MSTQLKNLHLDKGKGKSSKRMQQAVDEREYLVTFNWSISQAMARTMQDLSEGIFISMANFTLARRDSYLEYFTCWCEARHSLHCVLLPSIFRHFSWTNFSLKLRKKCQEVKRGILLASFTGNPVIFTRMLSMTSLLINRTRSPLSQLGSRYVNDNRERKVVASLPLSHRNRPRVLNNVNYNNCVKCVTGLKNCACVSGMTSLNPSPVMAGSRNQARADHPDRMVPSLRGLPSHMLPVAPAPSGPVYHQVQQQTSPVCITSSRPPGMGSGFNQPVLGRSGSICLPTSSHLGQSGGKVAGLPMQQNHSDCTRVAKHALV